MNDTNLPILFFTDTRHLLVGDDSYFLEPRVASTLLYLIENQGEVVLRESLVEHVWLGTIVTEHALNRVIMQLRKCLGTESIKTIYKKGYLFTQDVQLKKNSSSKKSIQTKNKITSRLLFPLAMFFLFVITKKRYYNHFFLEKKREKNGYCIFTVFWR